MADRDVLCFPVNEGEHVGVTLSLQHFLPQYTGQFAFKGKRPESCD